MTYRYSDLQATIVTALIDQALASDRVEDIGIYTSPYQDLTVLVKVVSIDMDSQGGAGLRTEWTAVDWKGTITRNADMALTFETLADRVHYFNTLVKIKRP